MSTQPAGPAAAKRRGQAIAGGLAGVAVVAVLVAVFVAVRAGDSGDETPAAQAPASAAPEQPTAPPQPEPTQPAQPDPAQPAPVQTPAGLTKEPEVKAGTGTLTELKVTPLVAGRGPVVRAGQTITANYKLVSYQTGELMDSSWQGGQGGQPFSTSIGTGQVIKGWDQGIPGQKVGSRIQLDVPADLAYGPQRGDLRFVVDILAAQ